MSSQYISNSNGNSNYAINGNGKHALHGHTILSSQYASEPAANWETDPRWRGVTRPYKAEARSSRAFDVLGRIGF